MTEPVEANTLNSQESTRNDKEYNFAQIRKQLEQERQARLQAEDRANQLERASKEKPSSDDDDDEPYVDHKKLERKFANFEKSMELKIDQKAEQKARALLEEEKKNIFLRERNDFNQVMSPDTIQKFADKYPGLAENILKMPEGFERQKLVYENIKALGLDKPDQKPPSIQEKIDQNRKSPYYQPSGVGTAPYNNSGDYSPQGQKSAYDKMKELQQRMRG